MPYADLLLTAFGILCIMLVTLMCIGLIVFVFGKRKTRKASFTQLLMEHEASRKTAIDNAVSTVLHRKRDDGSSSWRKSIPVVIELPSDEAIQDNPNVSVRTLPDVSFPIQASAEDFVQKCRCPCHRAGGSTVKHVVACCVNGFVSGWGVQQYDRTGAAVVDWASTKGVVPVAPFSFPISDASGVTSTPTIALVHPMVALFDPPDMLVGQASSGVLNLSVLLRNSDLVCMMRREVSSVKVGL